ncbi:hypothetical protein SLEP1_g60488 [Rubroshorea leprosula]|uniref:CRESS-DNA virus Rep endonuclease domain-containing protein n=1 Tax=Rubroshorea leprosula TaxID=152421 RepID=A0AAV5MWI5_9ROSI|nr:hypothetical protein SLEP1_g60488 [Rubroshorea leprosula]
MSQGSNWVFTLNNPTSKIEIDDTVQYCLYQLERGVNGTEHYQGYIQMRSNRCRMSNVKRVLGDRAHVEKMRGSQEEAIAYASKDDTRIDGPWECGLFVKKGSNKRKRIDQCRESPERMAIEEPDLFNAWRSSEKMKKFRSEYMGPILNRGWQLQLTYGLEQEPDSRTVHWVFGPQGAEGKSTYAKWLDSKGWVVLQPASVKDMTHLYGSENVQAHLCIDISRRVDPSHMDNVYEFIEMVKNRNIQVTKYRSYRIRELNQVHVVVMSNHLPDYCKISVDRIKLIEC